MVGDPPDPELYIPPPSPLAEFPLNVQLLMVGEPSELAIAPPPSPLAEFPLNMQLLMIGEPSELAIAPPFPAAELLLNVQLLMVGEGTGSGIRYYATGGAGGISAERAVADGW